MAVQSSPTAQQAAGGPAGGAGAGPPRRHGLMRLFIPGTVPATLWLLIVGCVTAALVWGAVVAWTVSKHASAAADVVSTREPLSADAQRMYQSLSDADVTATTAFLSGPQEPLASRQRYQADIAHAATDLAALKDAATGQGNRQLGAGLAAVSAGLPVYTGYVAQAQSDYALGFQLTGGSFMQVASEEMNLTLLPAAAGIYAQENARLAAESASATGLPWVTVAVLLALVIGFALYRAQRWLSRRTHRIVNYGLLAASAALAIGAVWLIIAFGVARADLEHGVSHGSVPAQTLARASIDVQQARADEILNLISRSGSTSFEQNFHAVRKRLGPGSGTLLTDSAAASRRGPGGRAADAAQRDAGIWYAANEQVYRLDLAASYAAETRLVLGTRPGSSAAGFRRLERDLSQAIAADQAVFTSGATAAAGALSGVNVVIIVVSLLVAAGCAWGITRRLAEYR